MEYDKHALCAAYEWQRALRLQGGSKYGTAGYNWCSWQYAVLAGDSPARIALATVAGRRTAPEDAYSKLFGNRTAQRLDAVVLDLADGCVFPLRINPFNNDDKTNARAAFTW